MMAEGPAGILTAPLILIVTVQIQRESFDDKGSNGKNI